MLKPTVLKDLLILALLGLVTTTAFAKSDNPDAIYCRNQTSALRDRLLIPEQTFNVELELRKLEASTDQVFSQSTTKLSELPEAIRTDITSGREPQFSPNSLPAVLEMSQALSDRLAELALGHKTTCNIERSFVEETDLVTGICEKENNGPNELWAGTEAWTHGILSEIFSYNRALNLCAVTSQAFEFGDHFRTYLVTKACETRGFIPNSLWPDRGKVRAVYVVIEGADLESPMILGDTVASKNLAKEDIWTILKSIPHIFDLECRAWQVEKYQRKVFEDAEDSKDE